ncbi:MAG: hypothetical protein KDE27_31680 [Planctomycetes bacterium]|nr:hypothetical protein [Planctomycetota bacterium]
MAPKPLRTLSLWIAVGALTGASLAAQTPAPPPIDPALPERLKELKDMASDREMKQDFQAIGLIQSLTKEPDKLNPKDQSRLAKALGAVFKTGKVRPAGQDHLYREAANALAGFGEEGAKELAKAFENKKHEDNIALRAHLLEAIGKTQDEDQIELLLDEATRSPHDDLRAAAGTGLGEFTNAKVKDKREIVEKLIRSWGALHAQATRLQNNDPNAPIDFGPQNARRTLDKVESRWIATLTRLTGQSMTQFEDWQRWENKNPHWEPPSTQTAKK